MGSLDSKRAMALPKIFLNFISPLLEIMRRPINARAFATTPFL